MLADQEVTSERLVSRKRQYGFKTDVSSRCFTLADSKRDIDALQVDAKSPPDACIHIAKALTQARTQLSFVLPFRLMAKCDEIRLQYRCIPGEGDLAGVQSLLVANQDGKGTPLTKMGPTHTSTWQGQVTVSDTYAMLADLDAGHDRLVWTMEFQTDPVSCDLIDVGISARDCWVLFKGCEFLRSDAAERDHSAMPAGDDLAELIRLFETQYETWGQMRQALADEIDHLRRRLDEAHVKPASARNR